MTLKHHSSTTITKSSQITLPSQAQRALGVGPGDRLEITIEDNRVTYSKPRYTLDNVFGSVAPAPHESAVDLEERLRLTQDEHFAEKARAFRDA